MVTRLSVHNKTIASFIIFCFFIITVPQINSIEYSKYHKELDVAEQKINPNYLIITAEAFAGSIPLNQFIDFKQEQGFNVEVYTAYIGTSRTEIKTYIKTLWDTYHSLEYVLIIGDAYGGLHSADATATNVTIPVWVGNGSLRWITDSTYVCMDGESDWFADIALGRLPIKTVGQLQAIIDKIIYVETGNYTDPDYTTRAAFLANPDPNAHAEELQDEIISLYMNPNHIVSKKLYYDRYHARTADVINAFNDGCFLLSYFGHSNGWHAWAAPRFDTEDVDLLENENFYPFVIDFECTGGSFQIEDYGAEHVDPMVDEKLLRVPLKGASAVYSCTNYLTYEWSTWANMYRCLMATIYTDGIRELGKAYQAAIQRLIMIYGVDAPVCHDYADSFIYLGDPSMRLPDPVPENYLIITAEAYANSLPLQEFVAAKQTQGMNVNIYSVPSGTSNTLIKDYIRNQWGTSSAPDYILLVGDTDGFTATTTTIPHWQGAGDIHAATDWPYVCLDNGDDWYPNIPIGRFSVRTIESLENIVDKTLFVETGNFPDPNYIRRGTFIAASGTNDQAEPTHTWVIDHFFSPRGYTGNRLYSSEGATTNDITRAVNNGSLFTTYFGHSSSTGWWDPGFFQSNVQALANQGLYGLMLSFSCRTAKYDLAECFGETWLRTPSKGSAAYIAASDEIYSGSIEAWESSSVLEKEFYSAVFQDNIWTIGNAWVATLYRFLEEYGAWDGNVSHLPSEHADICRNYFEEYVLLGDPSLQLPQPKGFLLTAEPEQQNICSPLQPETSYTINVVKEGDFTEPVFLQTNGAPAGSTILFTINNQTPPFISILTLQNLDGCEPGIYAIEIQGTSNFLQSATTVTLTVSTDVPFSPVLLNPENGAININRKPTLSWQSQGNQPPMRYIVEVATDEAFTNSIYSAETTLESHTVDYLLDVYTLYYWRVQTISTCGESEYSTPRSFTTIQREYYTEEITDGEEFFLQNTTVTFTFDDSESSYVFCHTTVQKLPTNITSSSVLDIPEDGCIPIILANEQQIKLYSQNYSTIYVHENGCITFENSDSTSPALITHFQQPQISVLYTDLSLSSGGSIWWKQLDDRVTITYQNVTDTITGMKNTVQLELFFSGEIHITWLSVDVSSAIIGLSEGLGIPEEFVESELDSSPLCYGACCCDNGCEETTQDACNQKHGFFHGVGTDCTPNPCMSYDDECLIISEIIQGTESGDCPRWIEITNTGLIDFAFLEGGVIIQQDDDTDTTIDIDLSDVIILAGESLVINSNVCGVCVGSFEGVYGFPADFSTNTAFGFGNERFMLTDTADGSHIIDIYGVFGENGTGTIWEFTDGYSYRLSSFTSGSSQDFHPDEWFLGGVGSLRGESPGQLLRELTTPGTHIINVPCHSCRIGDLDSDGDVDLADLAILIAHYGHDVGGDTDFDGDTDLADLANLLGHYGQIL